MSTPIDDFKEELRKRILECSRAIKEFKSPSLLNAIKKFEQAIDEIQASWSGSSLGYHSSFYIKGFRERSAADFFDSTTGIQLRGSSGGSKTVGEWRKYGKEVVIAEIKRRAAPAELSNIAAAAVLSDKAFTRTKEELLALLDALLSIKALEEAEVLYDLKQKAESLDARLPESEFLDTPPVNRASKDTIAKVQGVKVPHHLLFRASLRQMAAANEQCDKIMQLARRTLRVLENMQKLGIKEGRVAIGHGHSLEWRKLKDFLQDRLELKWDEFNRVTPAGKTAKDVLLAMLDNASFAFLVMTADDEHANLTKHARLNVIHEAGLFQGRLGFERAIILFEEGCSGFSNIAGLQVIEFPAGRIQASFEEVREVLEREGIIKKKRHK